MVSERAYYHIVITVSRGERARILPHRDHCVAGQARAYYYIVITVSRGERVFLVPEGDAVFRALLKQIAHAKGWRLVELETMPNHVHLLVKKPPWTEISANVRQIKGISARRLRERFPRLMSELLSGHLWARGHHDTRHTDASLEAVTGYTRNLRRIGGPET